MFGEPVVPGAPVLARLGAFIEGPGLPAAPVRAGEPAAVLGGDRASRRRGRLRDGARDRRARRVDRPAGEDLQPRHEAAARHRPGHARPARAARARRADQRPRPAADRRDARGHAALRARPDARWWCPATCSPRSSRPARTSSSCTRAALVAAGSVHDIAGAGRHAAGGARPGARGRGARRRRHHRGDRAGPARARRRLPRSDRRGRDEPNATTTAGRGADPARRARPAGGARPGASEPAVRPAAARCGCGSSSPASSSGDAPSRRAGCCSCCRSSSRSRSRSAAQRRPDDAAALVDLATTGASNFALFTEFAAVGFLLVVIVALFCGDTVASEASWSSLRYLLAQPVPRSRLLRQKLIVAADAERRRQPAAAGVGVRRRAGCSSAGRRRARRSAARSTTAEARHAAAHRRRLCLRPVARRRRAGVPAQRERRHPARRGRRRGDARRGVEHPRLRSRRSDPYRHYLPTHCQYSWLDALGPTVVLGRHAPRHRAVRWSTRRSSSARAWLRFDRKDITS